MPKLPEFRDPIMRAIARAAKAAEIEADREYVATLGWATASKRLQVEELKRRHGAELGSFAIKWLNDLAIGGGVDGMEAK